MGRNAAGRDPVHRLPRLPGHAYHREAATLFLLGAVARAFYPGHKFDFVPILEGAQGDGKSTFIRILGLDWAGELAVDFASDKKR